MYDRFVSPLTYIISLAFDLFYYVGTTSRRSGGAPLGRGPMGELLFLRCTKLSELDLLTTSEFLVAVE